MLDLLGIGRLWKMLEDVGRCWKMLEDVARSEDGGGGESHTKNLFN
ncbi:hypothetical protein ACT2XF_000073 [Providencia rettgeri]